jgi:preprotein translocase subunit Sec63
MVDFATGKLKMPIEIQHLDGAVTFCFILIDNPESLYDYIVSVKEFLPVMILSGDVVYIAKSNIKAFRSFDLDKVETSYVWSFDPYTILGVDADISPEDLHNHYINLLKQVHPDIVGDKNLHSVFKELAIDITRRIISAYEFIRTEKLSRE